MHQIQDAVRQAMQKQGMSVDRFNPPQAVSAISTQLDLLGEKLLVIADGVMTKAEKENVVNFAMAVKAWGEVFRKGNLMGALGRADHAKQIQLDFALAWTSLFAISSTAKYGLAAIAEGCAAQLEFAEGRALRPVDFSQFIDPDAKD